ncbi:caspase family protein [Microcoleus sp. N9_B2]|uniref:nSTAND1 domain-containing NTPase n=1 Tax=unclassified Microcoleus TaxID=2642155 RepID=UPI002FD0EAB2
MPNFEHSHALIIGINDYDNGISRLKTAVPDATEIARILETEHDYTVHLLPNQEANLSQLRQVLEIELPQQIQAGDRFLFYFAGHGIALNGEDGPEGYLVPQDARLGNVSTYLSMSEVNKALLQLPCRHFLGILDCCFAGAFRWSSLRKAIAVELGTLHKEGYERFIQDPAWQVVTSAAYDQSAWDAFDLKDDRGHLGSHSPFACALIEALEGKADAFPPAEPGKPAGDGVMTATDLYVYLRDRVEVATEARAIRQTPGIYPLQKHDKGEYIFLTPRHALNLPPAPPLDTSKNPYRGLLPFEEKHSDLFFGRNALTQKLYEFVTSHSLTVVLGASGSGKSSLVKAGLISKLRQCKDGNPWFILPPFRPGEYPFQALNNLLASVNLPTSATPNEAASSGLLTPARSLANWFKEHPQANLLLVVDQFEELITLCLNDQERQQFLEALAGAIATHPNQLHLILTLRSGFELQFRNTVLEKNWLAARFIVPAMTREELRQAIEEPASARVMYFDPHELVEQLIDEVANMPGALPLLSFALSELYLKYLKRQDDAKNRRETIDRAITQTDYEDLGGVTRSLTQRADREYEALIEQDSTYAQTIRNVMLRMVAVGGELAQRRVPLSELEYPEPENGRIKTVIKHFEDARLLTFGNDSEGQPYQEPAHDALVRGWQKLLEWKKQELTNVLVQRELTPTANQWASSSKNASFQGLLWNNDPRLPLAMKLLCGSAYKDTWLNFLKWMCGDNFWKSQSNDFWLNSNEAKFVTDSFDKKYTKRRNDVSLTSGILIYLLVLNIFAPKIANTAEKRRINADITNLSLSTGKHNGSVPSVSFSPNGKIIASGGADGTIKLWTSEGNLIKTIEKAHLPYVQSVEFSPDGLLLASAGNDGMVKLWTPEGKLLKSFRHGYSNPK